MLNKLSHIASGVVCATPWTLVLTKLLHFGGSAEIFFSCPWVSVISAETPRPACRIASPDQVNMIIMCDP